MPRTPKGGPTQHVANILGRMKSGERNRMLEDIAARDAQTAQTVRALMFTFDDLIRIDARGIQELLRNIDMDQLACALKGASPEIQKLFYVNMSDRAAKMLRENIDAMGAMRMADVDEARMAIVDTALSLADAGTIIIGGSDDDIYVT